MLPVVAILLLPLALGIYWQKVLLSVAVFAMLAISWDILAQSGMIPWARPCSSGPARMHGHHQSLLGTSPLITLPLAALFGGLISTALLLPVLRLRGMYFPMVTLIIP